MPKKKNPGATNVATTRPNMRVAKNVYRSSVVSTLLKVFFYVPLVLAIIYVCFAATIVRVVPTLNEVGFVPVKNMTYPGGMAPQNAVLLVHLDKPQGDGIVDRLKQSFIPSERVALVSIVGGPYGKLSSVKGEVVLDGKNTRVRTDIGDREFLNDEYLATCLKGSCVAGEGVIFSADNIYGQPLTDRS